MPINPIRFGQQVNEQFLRYQHTAFPLADPELARQARELLRGRGLTGSPLFKGPYITLSRAYAWGCDLHELAEEGKVHPALPGIAPYPQLFAHQERALEAILRGQHCLIVTGTGSGKTEAFLYPILDHCLRLRDAGAPEGVVAVLVYPMNALALDQLLRLREMLAGTGISYGMYVGTTPRDEGELTNAFQLGPGATREQYLRERKRRARTGVEVLPPEERATEQAMAERPPRLLLTNYKQLELLLTRGRDLGMFMDAPLRFLVFDEAHTYSGALGSEVACLIRRLRAFCRKGVDEVVCIGTSATILDPQGEEEAGRQFMHRLFGVPPAQVAVVQEEYREEEWPADELYPPPPAVPGDPLELLDRTLQALEEEGDVEAVAEVVQRLTGRELEPSEEWPEALYELLRRSRYVQAAAAVLQRPMELEEAVQIINNRLGRVRPESQAAREAVKAELLAYLALGAAAERRGEPLLRPTVHYFVRGLEGMVATLEPGEDSGPPKVRLYFSVEQAREAHPERERTGIYPVLVCKNCGQHYFEAQLRGFQIADGEPTGGEAEGENVIWTSVLTAEDEAVAGRLLFTHRFLAEAELEAPSPLDSKRFPLWLCSHCGTVHRREASQCANPKCRRAEPLLPLWGIIPAHEGGQLLTCPSCGFRGKRFGDRVIEPTRPLRAVTVADVHILAQDMLNALDSERQKLLIFTDNRQDAAFQAGWMQDHARRYRLRHLIYEYIRNEGRPVSIGDIEEHLLKVFRQDKDLAISLAPEVYRERVEEAYSRSTERELRRFLRITLLRELATSFQQKDGLEVWGVIRVEYDGLDPQDPELQAWAERVGLSAEEAALGIAALLDVYRRGRHLYDPREPIFSRQWREGDEEVLRGYLPLFDWPPKGLKLEREPGDKTSYITPLRAPRGHTLAEGLLTKWGVPQEELGKILEELWKLLTEKGVLRPVPLVNRRGRPLAGASGVHQIDSTRLGIVAQWETYRCRSCRRVHPRPTPHLVCTKHRCPGTLERVEPDPEDYNLALLQRPFVMVRPREHSAQVPGPERQAIEQEFKKPQGRVNTLVSTPTLELGVDIGALDMILMRNVPPQASNYWQRAGRGGRRHRMAIIYTYCRRSLHDRYFFEEPSRLLEGKIAAPRFNLRNPVLIRKHVHAVVISELLRLSRELEAQDPTSEELEALKRALTAAFPPYIHAYLFEEKRHYRSEPTDAASPLSEQIRRHESRLLEAIRRVFAAWPEPDAPEISSESLQQVFHEMPRQLQGVIDRLHRRMVWALQTRRQLMEVEDQGLLDEYEKTIRARCEQFLSQLAEESLETYTLNVLAAEGFLPGYILYDAGIVAFVGREFASLRQVRSFQLSRPPALALREFIPGNRIYANGGEFRVVRYRLPVGEEHIHPESYRVDVEVGRVEEARRPPSGYDTGSNLGLQAIGVCDVELAYISRISDELQYRFQLPVTVMGYLQERHRGIEVYAVGEREIEHRRGQEIRLVNVGPANRVRRHQLGYPVCLVCGAIRSPYASALDWDRFREIHRQRCGREPQWIGFYASSQVDGLLFRGLEDAVAAASLGEALRLGAEQVLEMEREDLQLLPLPQADGTYDLFLYDPMPGGSGLLDQLLARWRNAVQMALELLARCPMDCATSCYECLRTYRNLYLHSWLDRHRAGEVLAVYDEPLNLERRVPPARPSVPAGRSTHPPEERLEAMLQRAGFSGFERQQSISIGPPYRSTTPDFLFRDEKVAVYLDGLSKGLHGDPQVQRRDQVIRRQLEAQGWRVIVIGSSELEDLEAMKLHFQALAHALGQGERAERLVQDPSWLGRRSEE